MNLFSVSVMLSCELKGFIFTNYSIQDDLQGSVLYFMGIMVWMVCTGISMKFLPYIIEMVHKNLIQRTDVATI